MERNLKKVLLFFKQSNILTYALEKEAGRKGAKEINQTLHNIELYYNKMMMNLHLKIEKTICTLKAQIKKQNFISNESRQKGKKMSSHPESN